MQVSGELQLQLLPDLPVLVACADVIRAALKKGVATGTLAAVGARYKGEFGDATPNGFLEMFA